MTIFDELKRDIGKADDNVFKKKSKNLYACKVPKIKNMSMITNSNIDSKLNISEFDETKKNLITNQENSPSEIYQYTFNERSQLCMPFYLLV